MVRQGCPKQICGRRYIGKMRWTNKICRGWVLLCALMAAPAAFAQGNTIVLKNGRRIVALTVTQDGDKVRYETSAGELTLPRAIVDHIESGGVPTQGGSADAGKLSLKPPESGTADSALTGKTEIEAGVIHDGEVDRNYVAKLENEALSGQPLANWNAALAHYAASQFELAHGEMDLALADEQQALKYAPQQPVFLMNAAYLHLRRSEY